MNSKLMKIYEDLTFKEAKENEIKRENANIDNTAMGTMLKYGSEGAKSSTRAMSSIRNFPKHMRRAISIFTIWTSTR